ncbi:MAG: MmgE/PrpD family protein [Solirubrobacterales bacterium]|nr:MmgE/PrpD family protein [Solirubrobacterales bacterium]
MSTAAERLASFSSALTCAAIPQSVLEAAKLHVLDTIGCGLAAHALDTAPQAREAMREFGESGVATVIGAEEGLNARDAALVNASLCHALDFDDTHPGAVAHISVVVAPAAIAMAETLGASGAELLGAVVAGNEVAIRIGMAAGESFHARGFHPTAVCGVFGAAAAAARLRGLDARATTHAFGIAGSLASGILEFLGDGSSTKRLHPGFAGHGGVTAAALAAHGATGPSTVLEGRFGIFHAFLHGTDLDIEPHLADLGSRWETPRIAFKPYPACHYLHAPLDATVAAVTEERLTANDVEELVMLCPPGAVRMVLEPAASKARPRSEYDAKFSLPYSVASYLTRGNVDISTYTEQAIGDEEVLALAAKVRYEVREFDTDDTAFPGGVRIRTGDGRVIERELPYQRGDARNPMSADEVLDKFRGCARLALPAGDVEGLEGSILALEKQPDLSALRALAGAARPVAA